jgi:trans-aconitate methyltransferase
MVDRQTVETYDRSAHALAAYFAGIGSRVELVERGLSYIADPEQARAVEVGCGDGRDAAEIVPRVGWYEGFDPSANLLALAKKRLPETSFAHADALTYSYPENLDIVYAFASYLHLNKDDFRTASSLAARALRRGGILLLTLKEGDGYQEKLVEDEFGKRMFYLYDQATMQETVDPALEVVYTEKQIMKHTTWLINILQKR